MLKHLHIQNYALIDSIDLDLGSGLSVITGETGAGKSILLGAILLLMGQRADTKTLFDSEKKCVIEGTFQVELHQRLKEIFLEEEIDFEDPCLIRREINPQGKSRSFINDTPVNLDSLRKIGIELVDIHSQQDHGWMSNPDFTLDIIDSFAQNQQVKSLFKVEFDKMQLAKMEFLMLEKQASQGSQGLDFLKFQWEELDKSNLQFEEFDTLKSSVDKLENAEQIREKLANLGNLVSVSDISTIHQLQLALQQAQSLSRYGDDFEVWRKRLESIWIELKDIASEIEDEAENFNSDPAALIEKQKRLDVLNRLMQKHHVNNMEDLIHLRTNFDEQISSFENIDLELERAENRYKNFQITCLAAADKVSHSRMEVLGSIAVQLTKSLQSLGIPNANMDWELNKKEVCSQGIDKIQLLFSANKGLAPKPFKQIISGGEMSRLMLSIKHLITKKRAMPTLILDEIDTGVSGEIAIQMGAMLTQMSQGHQIIAITHLPQIAAAGQNHWYVYKNHSGEKTISALKKLIGEERVEEIAKMIGGQKGYIDLKANVRKLMEENQK
jgi:DNA repair protein RecN (Recombination protein N)